MDKKKIVHLEIIRLIALFCIVYNHIGYILFEGLLYSFQCYVRGEYPGSIIIRIGFGL